MKPIPIILVSLLAVTNALFWFPRMMNTLNEPNPTSAYLVNEEHGLRYSYHDVINGDAPLDNAEPAGDGGSYWAKIRELNGKDVELILIYE